MVILKLVKLTLSKWFTLVLLLLSSVSFAAVTATVDKNPVLVNESFILEVTADEALSNDSFDNSTLNALFGVLRTSVQRKSSIVNGQGSQSTIWTTMLVAQEPGEYLIPSFNVGASSTDPIVIKVVERQTLNSGTGGSPLPDADVFLKTELSTNSAYIGQQIQFNVKLYYAAALQRGSLSEPTMDDAEIEQLGDDVESTELVNNQRYRVIERQYLIQPQKSGTYRLSSPFFEGEVASSDPRSSFFSNFNPGKAISTRGEDHQIEIMPIPQDYDGFWLPSDFVQLSEEWQAPENGRYKIGEPITRTITLVVKGVTEQQLPKLSLPQSTNFKLYPDQPELNTGLIDGEQAAQLKQRFAIIANQAGNIEIPEVRIAWWDTRSNQQHWAVLPAKTLPIQDINTVSVEPLITPNQSKVTPIQTSPNTTENQIVTTSSPMQAEQVNWLQWLFLMLWLVTGIGWWLSAKNKTTAPQEIEKSNSSSHWKNLETACKNDDAKGILKSMVPWVNEAYNPHGQLKLNHLSSVRKLMDSSEFDHQIDNLQAELYGNSIVSADDLESKQWSGKEILKILKLHKHKAAVKLGLPELN